LLEEVFELNESLDELRDARNPAKRGQAMSGCARNWKQRSINFESLLVDVDKELRASRPNGTARSNPAWDDAAKKKIMERMNEF